MNNIFDTVFFDWGGVVADDPGDEFLGDLLRRMGASEPQVQEIFRNYMKRFMRGQLSESDYWAELKTNYGFSIPDTISQEFMKWTGLEANKDVLDLVSSVKARGVKTAILSNVIEPTYNVLDTAGYYDRFDMIVASCKVNLAKPEEEIYTLALNMLNTTGERSIFIDDKESNLVPAKMLGFTTIHAQTSAQIIADLNILLG